MFQLGTILLVILVARIPCNGQLVSDLSQEQQDELLAIINNSLVLTEPCGPANVDSVSFLLFTRDNPDSAILLNENNLDELTGEKTILMIHGWMSSPEQLSNLKDFYLELYNANVIMANWTEVAAQLYTSAYCAVPAVAEIVAEFVVTLSFVKNIIPFNSIRFIGHSLGAHVSGFAAKNLQNNGYGKITRIIAADPSGPLFLLGRTNERLDSSDARFVDIIHTNDQFGFTGRIGDIDFYLNGGILQPGCPSISITNLFSSTLPEVLCSHTKSIEFLAASTLKSATSTNALVGRAQSCIFCPLLCFLCPPEYNMMGEFSHKDSDAKSFSLTTTASWPYGKGCVPFGNDPECIDVVNDIPS